MSNYVTNADKCVTYYLSWPIARADAVIHGSKVYYEAEDGTRTTLFMSEVGCSVADDVVIFSCIGRKSELEHLCNDLEECTFVGSIQTDVFDLFPYLAGTDPVGVVSELGEPVTEEKARFKNREWC